MKRRNFILALTALVVVAGCQTRAKLNETQKRMDAANEDLKAIVKAELGHIEKRGKFATLDELISRRDLGPEMAGSHGYVYSIRLEGNGITATAYPVPGEQLPALVNVISGPRLASALARLHTR